MPTNPIPTGAVIRDQHQQIRRLFASVGTATPEERTELVAELVDVLAAHQTAEATVVYPALERSGAQGAAIAAARRKDAEAVLEELHRLDRSDPAGDEFMSSFLLFQREVEAQAEAEEREVVPMLDRLSDPARREGVGPGPDGTGSC